jgi:hypothetical protein
MLKAIGHRIPLFYPIPVTFNDNHFANTVQVVTDSIPGTGTDYLFFIINQYRYMILPDIRPILTHENLLCFYWYRWKAKIILSLFCLEHF